MYIRRIRELKLWKKRLFCVFAVFFSLFFLFLVIRIAMPCREYRYEGSCFFEEDTPTENTVIYSGICLNPGVYRIELEYETGADPSAVCNVADGTVFTGGLLSNGEHMYSGLDRTGYDLWLYEGTEDLQVVVSYEGRGGLTTGNLTIIETRQLWTMLMTLLVSGGILFICAFVFYYYDRSYPVSAGRKKVFFAIMVISLTASLPYLNGYTISGADLTYHLQRIEGVKDGLISGQFPVRLEPEWVYGHGYASAVFYCNTFLYFPALLRMLGFTVTASYNMYCIVFTIASAWISYYCFGKMFGKPQIGVICSGLYTLSIFRTYRLIGTAAVGEGTAVTFIPLVIYGMYRIFAEDPHDKRYRTAWVPVMLGISGMIQSHVLTCEITAGVILLFCIIFIRKIFCLSTFRELCKAAAASVLFNLWFLIPFLDYYLTQDMHIKHVSARTIQHRGLYPAHLLFHYWTTGTNVPMGNNGMQYSHPVGTGMVLTAVLALFLILWFSGRLKGRTDGCLVFAKAVSATGVLLLFMSLNIFPWDRIQALNSVTASLVSSLQIPSRLLGWGTVCMVFVFGYCLYFFERCDKRYYFALAIAAFLCIATSDMYLLDFVNSEESYLELYNEEGMGFGYISGAEYLIEGTKEEKLTFAGASAGDGVEIRDYEKKYLQVKMQCANTGETDGFVDLPLLLYKGYRAVHEETGQKMQVCPGENNVVRVLIPAGFEGSVKVDFVSPVYWRAGEIISAVTIVVFAVLWLRYRRKEIC